MEGGEVSSILSSSSSLSDAETHKMYVSSSSGGSSLASSPMITPRVIDIGNQVTAPVVKKRGMSTTTVTTARTFAYNPTTSSSSILSSSAAYTAAGRVPIISANPSISVPSMPFRSPSTETLPIPALPIISQPSQHHVEPVQQKSANNISQAQSQPVPKDVIEAKEDHICISIESTAQDTDHSMSKEEEAPYDAVESRSSSPQISMTSETFSPDRLDIGNSSSMLRLFEDSAIHDDIIVETYGKHPEDNGILSTPSKELIEQEENYPSLAAYEQFMDTTPSYYPGNTQLSPVSAQINQALVQQFPPPSLPPPILHPSASAISNHEDSKVQIFFPVLSPSLPSKTLTDISMIVTQEQFRTTDSPVTSNIQLSPRLQSESNVQSPIPSQLPSTPFTAGSVRSVEVELNEIYPLDPTSLPFDIEPDGKEHIYMNEEEMIQANEMAMKTDFNKKEVGIIISSDKEEDRVVNKQLEVHVQQQEEQVSNDFEYEYEEDGDNAIAQDTSYHEQHDSYYYDDDDIDYSKYQNAYHYTTEAIYEEVSDYHHQQEQGQSYDQQYDYNNSYPLQDQGPPSRNAVGKKVFDNPYNISDDSDEDENYPPPNTSTRTSQQQQSSYQQSYPPQRNYYEDPSYQPNEIYNQVSQSQQIYYEEQGYDYDGYYAQQPVETQSSEQYYYDEQGYYDENQQYYTYDISYDNSQYYDQQLQQQTVVQNHHALETEYYGESYQIEVQVPPNSHEQHHSYNSGNVHSYYPEYQHQQQYASSHYPQQYEQSQQQSAYYPPTSYPSENYSDQLHPMQEQAVSYPYDAYVDQTTYGNHADYNIPPVSPKSASAPQVTFYNTHLINQQLASRPTDSAVANKNDVGIQPEIITAALSNNNIDSSQSTSENYDLNYDYDYTEEHFQGQEEAENETDPVITQRHLEVWEKFFENAAAKIRGATRGGNLSAQAKLQMIKQKVKGLNFQSNEARKYFVINNTPEPSIDSTSKTMKFPSLLSHKRYTLLLAYAKALDENTTSNVLYYALFGSIFEHDLKAFQFFLQKGLSLYMFDEENGFTLGHYIVCSCNESNEETRQISIDMMSLLSDYNMNFDLVDYQHRTMLHVAVLFNQPSMVEFLLQCAVDCDVKDELGGTALDYAMKLHRRACVVLLCDAMNISIPEEYLENKESSSAQDRKQTAEVESVIPQMKATPSLNNKSVSSIMSSDSSSGKHASFGPNTMMREESRDYSIYSADVSDSETCSNQGISHRLDEGVAAFSISIENSEQDTSHHVYPEQPLNKHNKSNLEPVQTPVRKGNKPLLSVDADTANKLDVKSKAPPLSPIREKPEDDDISDLDESDPTDEPEKTVAENVYDRTAAYVWGVMMYLVMLTIQLLTSKKKSKATRALLQRGDSNGSNSGNAKLKSRVRGESMASDYSDSDQDSSYSGFSKRTAPPTDDELLKQGLGGGSKLLPPPVPSPDRNASPVLPPKDVQLAIAMARAKQHQSPPVNAGPSPDGQPPLPGLNPTTLSRNSSIEQDDGGSGTPGGNSNNNYSIGRNLPPGVSWRYVNILDDNSTPTKV